MGPSPYIYYRFASPLDPFSAEVQKASEPTDLGVDAPSPLDC